MKTISELEAIPPYFTNPQGVRWWHDDDLSAYAYRPDHTASKEVNEAYAQLRVFYTCDKEGKFELVVVDYTSEQVYPGGTSLESIGVKTDAVRFLIKQHFKEKGKSECPNSKQ